MTLKLGRGLKVKCHTPFETKSEYPRGIGHLSTKNLEDTLGISFFLFPCKNPYIVAWKKKRKKKKKNDCPSNRTGDLLEIDT